MRGEVVDGLDLQVVLNVDVRRVACAGRRHGVVPDGLAGTNLERIVVGETVGIKVEVDGVVAQLLEGLLA